MVEDEEMKNLGPDCNLRDEAQPLHLELQGVNSLAIVPKVTELFNAAVRGEFPIRTFLWCRLGGSQLTVSNADCDTMSSKTYKSLTQRLSL